ncbi:DUF1569 domain-containing protein [Algoriphagus winogradskyi]|uniref:Oxepin-CoA hydrolase / 3-oxo-5,6-dehydrosuberyl-CoA semialdehyde dehydrogenase n=1 Tax=Algoriphagus winogradskyi TaxID=237017 RepID=A0ABY1NK75_9BACT|nr:DUF1569 domain-containing protein [Algoriphagus winogradskyi]SMP09837.1 Protein of unknown function [Algoriphagus winogradskyi]
MDITSIEKKLKALEANTKAEFGIMTPQHMVEHLTLTVKISYGRIKIPEFEPSEKQLFQKRALLDSTMEFPRGVLAPNMKAGELLPLRNSSLDEAKKQLIESLTGYTTFFNSSPDASSVHPRFGKLNYSEWEKFHPKHFKHHFGQFGIW